MLFDLTLESDGWYATVEADGSKHTCGPREDPQDAMAEGLEGVGRVLMAIRLFPARYPPEALGEAVEQARRLSEVSP